eukprot:6461564-Amphidinium_carterae.1
MNNNNQTNLIKSLANANKHKKCSQLRSWSRLWDRWAAFPRCGLLTRDSQTLVSDDTCQLRRCCPKILFFLSLRNDNYLRQLLASRCYCKSRRDPGCSTISDSSALNHKHLGFCGRIALGSKGLRLSVIALYFFSRTLQKKPLDGHWSGWGGNDRDSLRDRGRKSTLECYGQQLHKHIKEEAIEEQQNQARKHDVSEAAQLQKEI